MTNFEIAPRSITRLRTDGRKTNRFPNFPDSFHHKPHKIFLRPPAKTHEDPRQNLLEKR
jgi:hypothetical protein